tara:strand:+ start:1793 stop:1966 length:174 start_codon:yes stop_codon:yes gene_type:complete
MPKFKKDRSKFIMKGFSPFTSNEVTEQEKYKLWEEFMEEQEKKKKRLKLHKPEGGAY